MKKLSGRTLRKRLEVKWCSTISHIQKRPELTLVTDSQDVKSVKDYFGNAPSLEEFDGFFVKVGEGEYTEVYGFHGSVPDLGKDLYCITEVVTSSGREIRRNQRCDCPITQVVER